MGQELAREGTHSRKSPGMGGNVMYLKDRKEVSVAGITELLGVETTPRHLVLEVL